MTDFSTISLETLELVPVEVEAMMIDVPKVARPAPIAPATNSDDTFSLIPLGKFEAARGDARRDRTVRPDFTFS